MTMPFRDSLAQLFKARFPVLYLESYEEQRVAAEVAAVARDAARVRTPRAVWTWSATEGLVQPDGTVRRGTTDPADALDAALRVDVPSVLIFRDLHPAHGGERPGSAGVIPRLRDLAAAYKSGVVPRTLVLVSPVLQIPVELAKDVTIVDFPLPTEPEIRRVLDEIISSGGWPSGTAPGWRTAIRTAEATSPCVLWVDEIEKGFPGGDGGDSGTSALVFGSFLTWMQEKVRPVFVIATANDIERLPPELLRKGRFDEVFFVDLPTRAERVSIWQVHIAKRLRRRAPGGSAAAGPRRTGDRVLMCTQGGRT